MSEIKFHLTVHTPWRPLEGLLIDIKARFSNDPDTVEALRFGLLPNSGIAVETRHTYFKPSTYVTIASYNSSTVKFYKTRSSLVRFELKKSIFFVKMLKST
jgi:uncharacterized protein YdhG (YjbR/CyaY superfamily)